MKLNLGLFSLEVIDFRGNKRIEKLKKEMKSEITKRKRKIFKTLYFFFIFLRLASGFLVFTHPLEFLIIYLILDWFDFIPFINSWFRVESYHKIDKVLDYYTYLLMVLYFSATRYFLLLLVFLLYRSIGLFLFYLRSVRKIFLLFPNLVDIMFLALLLSERFSFSIPLVFFLLLPLKMLQEHHIHFNKEARWQMLKIKFREKTFKLIVGGVA